MPSATMRMPVMRLPKLDREHWVGSAVLGLTAALYLVAGISVTSLATADGRADARVVGALQAQAAAEPPPAPEPLKFRQVSPGDAVAYNASIPVAALANPAARAFALRSASAADGQRSLECLTAAIYYEAATEGAEGQRAVAQVVLNRVRHPAFPNSVCGVVFQGAERATGCQFTFTCDGSLARVPHPAYWARARAVAEAALAGKVYAPVGWATHYHTNWVVPYWSSSLVKLANVGTHIFYRWEGGWGRAPAFAGRAGGSEPVLAKMRYIGVGGPIEEIATPDQRAALAAGGIAPVDADMTNRAVIRRFEPARREDIAGALARQTPAGAQVENGYRWALTGDGATGEAFGTAPVAPAAPAAAN
jgi:spore germination cell wall hydrolase CwlJ-like protein